MDILEILAHTGLVDDSRLELILVLDMESRQECLVLDSTLDEHDAYLQHFQNPVFLLGLFLLELYLVLLVALRQWFCVLVYDVPMTCQQIYRELLGPSFSYNRNFLLYYSLNLHTPKKY